MGMVSIGRSPCSNLLNAKRASIGLFLALAGGGSPLAADEGGVSFWLSGQYASFAAIPPESGFSMPLVTYYYSGDAPGDQLIEKGRDLFLGVDARYLGQFIIPTYSPDTEVWGGRVAFSLATLVANSDVSADVGLGSFSTSLSDETTGFGDLYPTAQVFWNNGVNNWMVYATGAIPVGSYDPNRLANIGIGHAAIDVGGAYTYFNPDTGWEASATLGLTYNFENSDTDYTNGEAIHLDWAVSKFVSEKWQIGAVGFAYKQISDDEGAPEILDGFRSETYGIGPQLAYSGEISGRPIYASLRGYKEFETKNRTEGYAAFLTLSVSF